MTASLEHTIEALGPGGRVEYFDLLSGRPCLIAVENGRHATVPLTFGLAAARSAVPRLILLGDAEQAFLCLPWGHGPKCVNWGWGRA